MRWRDECFSPAITSTVHEFHWWRLPVVRLRGRRPLRRDHAEAPRLFQERRRAGCRLPGRFALMIAPARRAASDALSDMADHGTDLGEAIARVRPTLSDDRDRSLLLELVAGTLRMQAAIDYQLVQRVSRPLARLDAEVLRVLRLARLSAALSRPHSAGRGNRRCG